MGDSDILNRVLGGKMVLGTQSAVHDFTLVAARVSVCYSAILHGQVRSTQASETRSTEQRKEKRVSQRQGQLTT